MELITAFEAIVGQKLTSVVFIWDYLQFKFEDPDITLTVYTKPHVKANRISFSWHDFGVKDHLVDIIGKELISVEEQNDSFSFKFSNSSELIITSAENDDVSPEALDFRSSDGWWVINRSNWS